MLTADRSLVNAIVNGNRSRVASRIMVAVRR
jgi:hypothetical protein